MTDGSGQPIEQISIIFVNSLRLGLLMMKLIMPLMLALMLLVAIAGCQKREVPMPQEQSEEFSMRTNDETRESEEGHLTATFAGGCFWGTEYVFQQVPGVKSTAVGYMGGHVDNPTYRQVCYSDTNHAEVVQLMYDPEQISYEKLVKVFFKTHDPTTLNRQGPDVGTQYRSAVFYHDDEQKQIAQAVKTAFDTSGEFKKPIVTEITEAKEFWTAETYHQDYFKKNPNHPACHVVDIEAILGTE
jgi:peptide-methionine (S)-S-oxide reductase